MLWVEKSKGLRIAPNAPPLLTDRLKCFRIPTTLTHSPHKPLLSPLDAHYESMRPTPPVVPHDVSEAEARQAIVDQAAAELAVVKKRQRCDQKALLGLAHQAMRAGQILSPDDPRSLNTLSQFFERIHGMEREWFGVTSAMQPEP